MKKLAAFALVALLISPVTLFAAERKFKITTYYPAPYGEYKTLKVTDGDITAGNVLTSDGTGNAVWQSSGGGVSFTHYCGVDSGTVTPACVDSGGDRKYCPAGFKQIKELGAWGTCRQCGGGITSDHHRPPGMNCYDCSYTDTNGYAYVCQQV